MDQAVVDAVLEDWQSAPISGRLRSALRLLEAMTVNPQDLDRAFVDGLKAGGLGNGALEEAANVGFFFNFMNRMSDAFDFDIPTDDQRRRQAKMIQFMRHIAAGQAPSPSWSVGADGQVRPVELNLTREHLLAAEGETKNELRRAIEAQAARAWGSTRPDGPQITDAAPQVLGDYVNRVSLHAYRISDELVDELRAVGYSDGQIYEVTVAGALGAALAGIERLFAALYSDRDSTD